MSIRAVCRRAVCAASRVAIAGSVVLLAGLLVGPVGALDGTVFVNEGGLVVRKEADAESQSVTNLEEGEQLEVIETWHRVRLPSGKEGWVRASDVFFPGAGTKRLALLFTESGMADAAEWEPAVAESLVKQFGGEVECLDRSAFANILSERGLSVEAAEAHPGDFVGLVEGVDGIVVCDCREIGNKARLDCRYVDMRVGGLTREVSALGEAEAVEELSGEISEQLHDSLREVLLPHIEEGVQVEASGPASSDRGASVLEGMVLIPAGEFISLGHDGSRGVVSLDAFYLDKFEVTNAAYKAFDPAYTYPQGRDDHPASGITWENANAYAQWVGKRLPSEQEWEKACRYTDGRGYPWGNKFESDRANINTTGTTPVGSYEMGRSPYGIYDLVGNVWEWTSSPPAEGLRTRVLRGGAWSSNPPEEDIILRYTAFPDDAGESFGFRCAVSAGSAPE